MEENKVTVIFPFSEHIEIPTNEELSFYQANEILTLIEKAIMEGKEREELEKKYQMKKENF